MVDPGGRPVLPRGAWDLMPEAALLRARLRRGLLDVFERYGYRRVEPARIEYREVAERGLPEALRERTVRFIEPESGEVAVLPADVTPQVARMVAARLGGELPEGGVFRFAYAADLVRRPLRPGDRAELHQVGLELVGDDDPAADVEVIEVCAAALSAVGLDHFVVDLSHSGIARALLDAASQDPSVRSRVADRLARKDGVGAAGILRAAGASDEVADAARTLCGHYGSPVAVLAQVGRVRLPPVQSAVAALARIWQAVGRLAPAVAARVHLDPLEVRGFDYYTGMRFRVWAEGARGPVAGGGRYDDLVGRYGPPSPAVGFAVDLAALDAALPAAVRAAARPGGVLVAVARAEDRPAAVERARALRAAGEVAFVAPAADEAAARALADRLGAERVVWCAPTDMTTTANPSDPAPGAGA